MRYSWDYPDAPPYEPVWGERTSTIDWCEENYLISPYFAEFINTITNTAFVALAIYSVRNVIRERHERRFLYTALGFGLVGIGSWLFHMTLKYEYQLLDELPMIYATCIPSWSMFSYRISRFAARWLAGFFLFIALAVTGIYLYIRDPIFHQAAYAILTASVLLRSIYLMIDEVKDPEARREMMKTITIGIGSFLTGFALWVVDNEQCADLRLIRRRWGMPLGFFLELHGLWHSRRLFFHLLTVVMTGLGVYYYLVFLEYLRINLLGNKDEFDFVWEIGIFPHVDRKKLLANGGGRTEKELKKAK